MDARSTSSKVKVTASIDAKLVKAIDQFLEKHEAPSRSQLIEDILREWDEQQRKRELERQVEEYYLSLSDEERQEDREWSKIAARSAGKLWD